MKKLIVFIGTTALASSLVSDAMAQLVWSVQKKQEPMVCSFNCSNTYQELQKRCSPALVGKIAIDPLISINPFTEFDGIIATLKKDAINSFPLSYTFRQCEATCNAASTLDQTSREVIYYNQAFLDKIKGSDTKVRWAVRCIIAHEIGHHFMGHTLPSAFGADSNIRRKRERRADFFTGFVISRFPGATEQDAIEGILTLDPATYRPRNEAEEKFNIYPTLQNRIAAVKEGFKAAKNPKDPLTIAMFKKIDSVAKVQMKRNGRSSIYHVIDFKLSMGQFDEAKQIASEQLLNPDFSDKAQLWEYKSIADQNLGNLTEAIQSQRKAIELNKNSLVNLERLQLLLDNGNAMQKLESEKIKQKLESEKFKQKTESEKIKQNINRSQIKIN
ncbi:MULTISPECIES: hypothetical protein [unclassified Pedobacter]|uniref:hypothetical protein n=1 Tax=unclassified Pedobacter TaxID=2628915 RepID=UPI001E0BCEBF|nr:MULTISPECIES: hypothetical protein [unclassified Pedobacter]CAH0140828.1 hypothetical protein SRABI36_00540 [Pedobacter sp. Bi36]CAH0196555.1 hypothetical protein SRABI126_01634 [Pedobacter sp. Bi126]